MDWTQTHSSPSSAQRQVARASNQARRKCRAPASASRCGVNPLHACGTFRAVFSPVRTGGKQRPAYGAFLRIHPVEQRCFQFLILRQYRRPKPPAQQGVGNRLDTDTFLPIVQGDTVSVDVVTALMHQPPRSAVLAVIHDGDRFRLIVLHK